MSYSVVEAAATWSGGTIIECLEGKWRGDVKEVPSWERRRVEVARSQEEDTRDVAATMVSRRRGQQSEKTEDDGAVGRRQTFFNLTLKFI